MQSYCLHKAPENYRNSPDFLKYMLWEQKQYGAKEERGAIFLTREEAAARLAPLYKAIDDLRGRLRVADRGPDTKKRQETYDAIYRQIDDIQGQVSLVLRREKPIGMAPKAAVEEMGADSAKGKKPEERPMKPLSGMLKFPPIVDEGIETRVIPMQMAQKAEHIFTGTDAHSV